MVENGIFLDTSFILARLFPTDRHHARAVSLDAKLRPKQTPIMTSRAIGLEIGAALSKSSVRHLGIQVLAAMEQDTRLDIVPLTEPLYAQAWNLYAARPDKSWSLTDCISFIIMQERGIRDALTADVHFQQAGFTALLLEEN